MAGQIVLFALVAFMAVSVISGASLWDSQMDSMRGSPSRSHDRDAIRRSKQEGYSSWDMSNERKQKGERWENLGRESPRRQRFDEGADYNWSIVGQGGSSQQQENWSGEKKNSGRQAHKPHHNHIAKDRSGEMSREYMMNN